MQHQSLKVMAVDDDVINLEILTKNLKDAGYDSITFEDGDLAWDYLSQNPEDVDIVLLDKMMPRMNGIEVLKKMKQHESLRSIPVIIQTGDTGPNETKEGIAAGAYYYLEKPFDPGVMIAIVNAAARDQILQTDVKDALKQDKSIATMLVDGRFKYRSMEEAKKLAAAISHHADSPSEISIALAEIMVNAVEHGNLAINYDDKNQLMTENRFEEEVEQRMQSPEYKNRIVTVRFQREDNMIVVTITDEGPGFDWKKYLEFDPLRMTDLNGRGIATANLMGLQVDYQGDGSTVACRFQVAAEG